MPTLESSDEEGGDSGSFDFAKGQTVLEDADGDTMRVLLSTDNHLGYEENDDVRGLDSFAAFEEVLYLAKRFRVDLVLLAGDLFHENRPSRRTLFKTMEILRRYSMGQDPVQVQVLGDPKAINYLNPHISVDLPIFSIHGNHDDPTRDGGDLLAALDLLNVNLLVNYFGQQREVNSVQVSPILLQKGSTRLALYGLGSMREERLHRMWREGKVSFLRPQEDNANSGESDDSDNDEQKNDDEAFFNIFALHQNRDVGRGSKNCVQDSMIPEWMDIVVWGHEHECQIEFTESVVGTFRITQPGSSVATSLVSGEAVTKKIGILDIRGKQFRLHTVPLTQVRPFTTTDVILSQHRDRLDPEDNNIDTKVSKALEEEVELQISYAKDKREQDLEKAIEAGSNVMEVIAKQKEMPSEDHPVLCCTLVNPNQVLVRIRVEHSGFSTLNNQRFGAKFVDEVANGDNVLLFHRKKSTAGGTSGTSRTKKTPHKVDEPMDPEELEETNMVDIVRDFLEMPNQKLRLLEEKKLSEAMDSFVEKQTANAIQESTKSQLVRTQKNLLEKKNIKNTEDIKKSFEEGDSKDTAEDVDDSRMDDSALLDDDDNVEEEPPARGSKRQKAAPKKKSASKNVSLLDDDEDDEIAPPKRRKAATGGRGSGRGRAKAASSFESLDFEDDNEVIDVEMSAPKGRSRRAASKKKVNYSMDSDDDDDDGDGAFVDRMDDDDDDEVLVIDEPPKKKAASRSRARSATSAASSRKKRATSTRKTTGRKRTTATYLEVDDDDNDFNGSGARSLEDDWGSAATNSQV